MISKSDAVPMSCDCGRHYADILCSGSHKIEANRGCVFSPELLCKKSMDDFFNTLIAAPVKEKTMRSLLASALICALSLAACGSDPDTSSTAQASHTAGSHNAEPGPKITVLLHETQRLVNLAPGARVSVTSGCANDEAVVGGGATAAPANLTTTSGSLFFDGAHSGWGVEFRNDGSGIISGSVAVAALCVRGQLIPK